MNRGDSAEGESDVVADSAPVQSDPAPVATPEPPRKPGDRKASAEEVERVVRRAENLYHRPLKAEVVRAAREHRLSTVESALKVAEEAGSYSWKFVLGVLENWRICPPKAKPEVRSFSQKLDDGIAFYAAWRARKEAERVQPG